MDMRARIRERRHLASVIVVSATLLWAVRLPTAQVSAPGRAERINIGGREAAAERIIIKLRPGVRNADLFDIERRGDIDRSSPLGNGRTRLMRSRSRRADELLRDLGTHPAVEYAEPDYVRYPYSTPNDPAFANQWGLRNLKTPGADIHAIGAWDIARGAANVVIGVADAPLDIDHLDLRDRLWSAPAEFNVSIADRVVTCVPGSHGFWTVDGELACDPMYRGAELHGTGVVGVAGAAGDNGLHSAGVNWNSTLLPLTFGHDTGGFDSDAINAIEFAIQVKQRFAGTAAGNLRVINYSWGGPGYSQSLRDAIERAGANDILIVAAAGNSQQNLDTSPIYPAAFNLPNIITVAGSTDTDQLAALSNYGRSTVHLAAPGENIISSQTGGLTASFSGSSYAAPFVAGAAGLVLSRCPMSTTALKTLLLDSVDRRDQFAPLTITGGRLNVETALRTCVAAAPPAPPAISLTAPLDRLSFASTATINVRAAASDTDGTIASVDFYANSVLIGSDPTPPFVTAWSGMSPGNHLLTAVATDDAGLRTTSQAVAVRVASDGGGVSLPFQWSSQDIGGVDHAGSASYIAGTFFVNGSGAGISGSADALRFAYSWLDGDGEIIAHLTAMDDATPLAKAGVMIRTSLDHNAAGVALEWTGPKTMEFVTRTGDGASAAVTPATVPAPRWLRLVRVGNTVRAFRSSSGRPNKWFEWARTTLPLPGRVAIGLAVASRDARSLTTATFDSVAINAFSQTTPVPFLPELIAPASDSTGVNPSTPPLLQWSSLYATSYDVRFGTTSPPPLVSYQQSGTSFSPPSPLTPNTRYSWQILAYNSNGVIVGSEWNFTTGSIPPPALPNPWTSQDVGSTGLTGSAEYSDGTFDVQGAGADVWGTIDGFHFVRQSLTGDGRIVARVTGIQNTNPSAKAGVMIRESLAANAAHAILSVQPAGYAEFMTRSNTGAATTWLNGPYSPAPVWLSLTRSGTRVTAALSANGSAWTEIGNITLSMGSTVEIGLVVCSHDASRRSSATFDHVSVDTADEEHSSSLPEPWRFSDVGTTGLAGTAVWTSGGFSITGAGADIWGTNDGFAFVHQSLSADGEIVARLTGQQGANSAAKAGIMIRASVADDAAHVVLTLQPNGYAEFMTRATGSGITKWLTSPYTPVPVWLKLSRTGSMVTASMSTNGSTWTTIGSTPLSAGAVEVGLVVCSHDFGRASSAAFDNVTVSPR